MSDELFSREEVLDGLPGAQAKRRLFWIETHTAYMVFEARQAINRFLGEESPDEAASGVLTELGLTLRRRADLDADTLERYAPHWQSLVPDDPEIRAALIHLFGRKYKLDYQAIPRMGQALGLDEPTTRSTYQRLYDQPLESIFHQAEAPAEVEPEPVEETPETITTVQIEAELEWIHLARGEILFKQGERGDSFYILINGRLRTVTSNQAGQEQVWEIGHNDLVGETALLEGAAYPVTVYAVRDSQLIKFGRQSIERLARKNPAFMIRLIQRLARRLYAPSSRSRPKTVAVIPAGRDLPLADFSRRLVASLEQISNPLHLNAAAVDAALGEGTAQIPQHSPDSGRLTGWLSQQEAKYDLLIYEAEPELSAWTRRCLRQADRVLILAVADGTPEPGEIELELAKLTDSHARPCQELAILHPNRRHAPANTGRWLARRQVIRHHHLAQNSEADFDRLARFLTGKAIGIVFGGGLFRGFAHGGVIKALEEAGIRPDFVGGTSIGAAIGALYALGWSFDEILERGTAFAAKIRSYADVTLPIVSIITSRKLTRFTQALVGEVKIEDMWTSYFCISSNLSRPQMMIHQQGPLWRALRASYSLPTVMPPLPEQGEILVDGALYNNLPADIMKEMCEDGPVIAVNVSPKETLPKQYNFHENISAQQLLWSRINPLAERVKAPNLIETINRTMIVGREESWPQAATEIDLYLEPPAVVEYELGDTSALEPMIEASYRLAVDKIGPWLERLRERKILPKSQPLPNPPPQGGRGK